MKLGQKFRLWCLKKRKYRIVKTMYRGELKFFFELKDSRWISSEPWTDLWTDITSVTNPELKRPYFDTIEETESYIKQYHNDCIQYEIDSGSRYVNTKTTVKIFTLGA